MGGICEECSGSRVDFERAGICSDGEGLRSFACKGDRAAYFAGGSADDHGYRDVGCRRVDIDGGDIEFLGSWDSCADAVLGIDGFRRSGVFDYGLVVVVLPGVGDLFGGDVVELYG